MNVDWFENIISWACNLEYSDIPLNVVEEAKNQILSTLSAAIYGSYSDDANQISNFFGYDKPNILELIERSPKSAACLLSSWSMVYDFDDVMLGGHTGHSSVIVPLVLSIHSGTFTSQDIITAQVVANEISARFNIACALGQTRGQMASQLHLIGSAVARAKLEGFNVNEFKRSIVFALSSPTKQFLPAFLGSDAKYFCASLALREGWESCDFAKTTLKASLETLFGLGGFFKSSAQSYDKEILNNIGSEWFTLTNSYKTSPACGYISSTIDCVNDILLKNVINPSDIQEVVVDANIFTLGVERLSNHYFKSESYKAVSTLTFSPSFIVASMLTYGKFSVANLGDEMVDNSKLWDLKKKIKFTHNKSYSNLVLSSGIPVGLVLSRASFFNVYGFVSKLCSLVFLKSDSYSPFKESVFLIWKCFFSAPAKANNLHLLKKKLPSSVSVKTKDGNIFDAERIIPTGFAGQYSWSEKRELMICKYRDCLSPLGNQEFINQHILILDNFQSCDKKDLNLLFNFN